MKKWHTDRKKQSERDKKWERERDDKGERERERDLIKEKESERKGIMIFINPRRIGTQAMQILSSSQQFNIEKRKKVSKDESKNKILHLNCGEKEKQF